MITSTHNSSHIYYNIQLTNNNTGFDSSGNITTPTLGIPCNFSQSRAIPFLYKPYQYNVSVISFSLDSDSLPIQFVEPILGVPSQQPIIDTFGVPTVYQIAIAQYNIPSLGFPQSISWKPADILIKPPASPFQESSLNNEYFWNYSIEYFLDLINRTILLVTQNTAGYTIGAPYFSYDPKYNKISFNAPLQFSSTYVIPGWSFYINEALYDLLAGIPVRFEGRIFQNSIYRNNAGFYQIVVNINTDGSNIIPQYTDLTTVPLVQTANYVRTTQEYSSVQLWNPVASILFTSPTLPLIDEAIALPVVFGNNPNPSTNNADTLNILFDYEIGKRDTPDIVYAPSGEYRLTSLVGINPLTDLTIVSYWKDKYGLLHPLLLEAGSTLLMKILFRKKLFDYEK